MDVKLCVPSASIRFVAVKDPILSFVKSRRAITGTLAKFQLPALTYRGHCISSTAMPSANDATPQPCYAYPAGLRCIRKNNNVLFFCMHSQGSWNSYYTERIKTQNNNINSRRKGKPTAGWREEIDGDAQTRDAGNNEG